ncbi:hypothetical protein DY000_02051507 [Brassica cretica]|uniref:Uncharacterized protein n=1 Tax=Brassica cretica TaxID=69181 RepID=A0ABQ7ETM1_BRACR|nr:hypothetical protein DY000_02051507 [Brassica cretica]
MTTSQHYKLDMSGLKSCDTRITRQHHKTTSLPLAPVTLQNITPMTHENRRAQETELPPPRLHDTELLREYTATLFCTWETKRKT